MISTLLVIINARAETQQQLAAHQTSLKTKSLPHPFVNYSRIVTAVVIRFPPFGYLNVRGSSPTTWAQRVRSSCGRAQTTTGLVCRLFVPPWMLYRDIYYSPIFPISTMEGKRESAQLFMFVFFLREKREE